MSINIDSEQVCKVIWVIANHHFTGVGMHSSSAHVKGKESVCVKRLLPFVWD